jgi:PAS domain S-box-containing protein
MTKTRFLLPLGILVFLLALPASAQQKKVLILHSYQQGPAWVQRITDGFRSVLDASRFDCVYRYEYMNVLDADPADYPDIYAKRLGAIRFDLVLCAGNPALQFVVKSRTRFFDGVPIVFCGVNDYSAALLEAERGITGIAGSQDFAATIRLARKLHPRTKYMIVLANRQITAEGAAYAELTDVIRRGTDGELDVRYWEDPPLADVLRLGDALPRDTIIFDIGFFADEFGKPLPLESSTREVSQALAVPIYSCWESLLGSGIVGGMIAGGFQQGEAAARQATRILKGESAETIPVVTEGQNRYMFDHEALVRFGIPEKSLPEGSIVVNGPVAFVDRYRTMLWVSIAVLAALLILLAGSFVLNIAQRRLKEGISKSEARLALALEATGSGIWEYDPQSGRTWYDPRWYRMLGYEPCCMPDEYGTWAELLHPEDRAQAEAEVRRHVQEGTDFTIEFRMRAQDGSWRWISSSAKAVERHPTGATARMVGTHVDITGRREAEEAVRESARRYRFLYERSPAISLVIGVDGLVKDVNNAFIASLGFTREEVVGMPALELVEPAHREAIAEQLEKDMQGIPTPQIEVDARAKDGSLHTILFSESSALLREGERPTGVLATGIDITERRQATEQARRHEQQLIQADKMASLGILVSGVAHEINNPNNFILLNGRICSRVWEDIQPILREYSQNHGDFLLAGMPYSESQPKIGQLIAGIHEGAQRIKKIVQNLRDFARRDAGEMTEGVDMNAVVDSAVTLVRNLVDKCTSRFALELAPSLPRVTGNFQQLEQVVINLLTNACQALPDRDRGVTVATRAHPTSGRLTIEVLDQGVGIPQKDLAHVLDPFFTTKQSKGGTGLGLSISYNIVRNHGGDLAIASQPDQGTTVTVSLPIAGARA